MAVLRRLRRSDYRRTRWKNDGGWTTEIARDDAPGGGARDGTFDWRVSIADIERDGPFSSFPGIDRDLLLLAGNGIELDIDDAPPQRLDRRFQHVRFAGESSVGCRLLAGATRDFNVMVRRGVIEAEVIARPLAGPMLIFPQAGVTWLVHVVAGALAARAGDDSIAAEHDDTLLIDASGAARIVLEGSGELVLVRFTAIEPAAT